MNRSFVCFAVLLLLSGSGAAASAEAQDWFMDWAFEQSFSSTDPLRSPGGFTASAGAIAVWGPIGVHATVRSISEGADLVQECDGAGPSCVPGTLDVFYGMRSLGLGLSYDFVNPTDVLLTLALTGTKNWRTERIDHSVTGDRSARDLTSSLGLSASAHLRLRPLLGGLRPEFSVRYDYSGDGTCDASNPCWEERSAFGVSVGLGWVLRANAPD